MVDLLFVQTYKRMHISLSDNKITVGQIMLMNPRTNG